MSPMTAEDLAVPAVASGGGDERHEHLVQFYDSDDALFQVVGDYLAGGLELGEPVVVIATPEHCEGFCTRLRAQGLEVDTALFKGRFKRLDARQTLATFMRDGVPDWSLFKATIEQHLAPFLPLSEKHRLRAYGEMVDLLWSDGQTDAAIKLEEMWNDLQALHCFSLFCAYAIGRFDEEPAELRRVCGTHTHVVQAEGDRELPMERDPARTPYSHNLALEIAHRKEVERALRKSVRQLRQAQAENEISRKHLQDFVDNANIGLHWVDASGKILWANPAECELLGYQNNEYVGHHIAEFHLDAPVIANILARLMRNESLDDYPARLRAKDGSTKHVRISSTAYREIGKFIHSRCFTRDATAEKRLEEDRATQDWRTGAFARITAAIAAAVSNEEVYDAVVVQIAAALVASSAGLWILSDDGQTAQLVRSIGYAKPAEQSLRNLRLDQSPALPILEAIRTGKPLFIESRAELLARYPHLDSMAAPAQSNNIACIPLAVQGRTLGGFGFTFDSPAVGRNPTELLTMNAGYCAQALERLRLLADNERAKVRAETLYALAGAANQATNIEEIFGKSLVCTRHRHGRRTFVDPGLRCGWCHALSGLARPLR